MADPRRRPRWRLPPARAERATTAARRRHASDRRPLPGHILPTAATMVGVCMTVITILKLPQVGGADDSWIDELLAVDAFVFVTSAVFSYLSLRRPDRVARSDRFERAADTSFFVGLVLMTAVILFMTFRLA